MAVLLIPSQERGKIWVRSRVHENVCVCKGESGGWVHVCEIRSNIKEAENPARFGLYYISLTMLWSLRDWICQSQTTPAASKHWHEQHLHLCLPLFLFGFGICCPSSDVLSSLSSLDFFVQVCLISISSLGGAVWICSPLSKIFQDLSNAKQQRLQP